MNGKGSKTRASSSQVRYSKEHERIFGKNKLIINLLKCNLKKRTISIGYTFKIKDIFHAKNNK